MFLLINNATNQQVYHMAPEQLLFLNHQRFQCLHCIQRQLLYD